MAWLLPNGTTMITDAGDPARLSLHSMRTGRLIRTLATAPTAQDDPAAPSDTHWIGLTADSTGRHLLAVPSSGPPIHIDLAAGATTRPLPGGTPFDTLPHW